MTLDSGTRLGPYEILSPVGAGGMGEVYKAKDTRLDRTVAIKVLPEHFSKDPERRERFEREARAVSSLNHPHICTLHDIGQHDGIDFMVMEYIEGETLTDRLEKEALSLDQALQFGIQIADALDKAHRQGVVHRDLKPGNVMLTKPGVKLLDFGLAKLTGSLPPEGGGLGWGASKDSEQPTQQKPLTNAGAILGTVMYMAPEQLEGKEADARTDVFAFGAVLYEMVTGRKAFEGESQASLITAIMSSEPAALSELQPLSPRGLDRLVMKCLAKDPEDRWHSAHDLAGELEWMANANVPVGAAVPERSSWMRTIPLALAFLLIAVVTGIVARIWIDPSPERPRPITRFHVPLPRGESLTQTNYGVIAISPDGSRLVYVANGQLYLRSMGRDETIPLRGSQFARSPFFSDDGEWIGFFQNGHLQKLAVSGGSPIMLCEWDTAPRGASWRENEIVLSRSSGIFCVPASGGGSPELLIPVDEGRGEEVRQPQLLPGGEAVLFTRKTAGAGWDQADIVVQIPETNAQRVLVEGGTDARYVSSGHLLFVREGALLGARFDVKRLQIVGSPVSLVEDVVETGSGAGLYGVSRIGSLVYVTGAFSAGGAGLVRVSRDGQASPLENTAEIEYHSVRLAPDDKRVAADSVRAGALWVLDLERGTRVLVERSPDLVLPAWNPDGSEIAFGMSENERGGVYIKRADGTGEKQLLFASDYEGIPTSWSRDGRFLVVTETHPATGRDIWLIPRDGKPQPLVVTEANENAATFSPDGKWIAYRSDASGRAEIYMQSFPGPGHRVPVSTNGGSGPVWAPDGRELYYRQGTAVMAVPIETEPELAVGAPTQLFDGPYLVDGTGHASYDISPDGEWFLMIAQGSANRLEVVLNWSEELKRLALTDN